MKRITTILLMIFSVLFVSAQTNFLADQKKYNRVRTAIDNKEKLVTKEITYSNIENLCLTKTCPCPLLVFSPKA